MTRRDPAGMLTDHVALRCHDPAELHSYMVNLEGNIRRLPIPAYQDYEQPEPLARWLNW